MSQEAINDFFNAKKNVPIAHPLPGEIKSSAPTPSIPGVGVHPDGPVPDPQSQAHTPPNAVVPATWQDKARIMALIWEVVERDGVTAANKIIAFVNKELAG